MISEVTLAKLSGHQRVVYVALSRLDDAAPGDELATFTAVARELAAIYPDGPGREHAVAELWAEAGAFDQPLPDAQVVAVLNAAWSGAR